MAVLTGTGGCPAEAGGGSKGPAAPSVTDEKKATSSPTSAPLLWFIGGATENCSAREGACCSAPCPSSCRSEALAGFIVSESCFGGGIKKDSLATPFAADTSGPAPPPPGPFPTPLAESAGGPGAPPSSRAPASALVSPMPAPAFPWPKTSGDPSGDSSVPKVSVPVALSPTSSAVS